MEKEKSTKAFDIWGIQIQHPPHGHVASIDHHGSEAGVGLSLRAGSGSVVARAAASGHQLGAAGAAVVGASVAGLYQLLQNVVGLGVVAQALQHPHDVAVRVAQFEKAFHFGVLLLVVHGRLRVLRPRLTRVGCVCMCVGDLASLFWLVSTATARVLEQLTGVRSRPCKHRKHICGLAGVFRQTDCGLMRADRICTGDHSLMTLNAVVTRRKPLPRPERGSKSVHSDTCCNFTPLGESSHQSMNEWKRSECVFVGTPSPKLWA